jgi:regulator of sigma E protease
MSFLFTLASFLVAITLLVFIHEYGHFKVARLCGIKVKRFSIGFGKPFFTRVDKHGTEWAIAPFPLGGYISMVDTRVEEPAPGEESMAFDKKPLLSRAAVVLAGPLANLIFAWAAWSVLLTGASEDLGPYLGSVIAESSAQKAGFEPADKVVAIDGAAIRSLGDIHVATARATLNHVDAKVAIERDGKRMELVLPTSQVDPADMASGRGFQMLGFANPAGARFPAKIRSVVSGDPADLAGIREGDTVVSIDGQAISTWSAMGAKVGSAKGQTWPFIVKGSDGKERALAVSPRVPAGSKDGLAKVGATLDPAGLSPEQKKLAYVSIDRGIFDAMGESATRCVKFTKMTIDALGSMLTGHSGSDNISGPVGIAKQAGDAAESGIGGYGNFLAFLSLSLFFMNLLPLPGLDGGHLAMFAVEGVTRKPLSERTQAAAAKVGFSLLAALMVFALFNDISHLLK